jgi:site-specific DNA recombinase
VKIEKELQKPRLRVSNLEKYVNFTVDKLTELRSTWTSSDYIGKQGLQYLVFPNGIYYNKKNGVCRTTRINEVFSCIAELNRDLKNEKTVIDTFFSVNDGFVLGAGIEPARPQWPRDFKSLVSTSSTTRAGYGLSLKKNLLS